jgi:hypothetical protein
MTTPVFQNQAKTFFGLSKLLILVSALSLSTSISSWADDAPAAPVTATNTMNNGVFDNTTVGLNGSTNNGNINGNQNTLGLDSRNTNQTYVNTPNQSVSTGGTSALVLPRNPLNLGNANLGRSNFGLQFGLNNNPILGNLNSVNGKTDAMSWFMQGGLTIPFGKIPDIIANPRNNQLDDIRQQRMMDERQVFGSVQNQQNARANVQGKVVRLNAYNYATSASPKLEGMKDGLRQIESEKANLATPKVLALADALVYSKPLGKGDKVGTTAMGEEYRYVGHTNSGWVKIIMSNGQEGWVKGQFEYLKNDYTEIDTVTLDNPAETIKTATSSSARAGKIANSNASSSSRKQ